MERHVVVGDEAERHERVHQIARPVLVLPVPVIGGGVGQRGVRALEPQADLGGAFFHPPRGVHPRPEGQVRRDVELAVQFGLLIGPGAVLILGEEHLDGKPRGLDRPRKPWIHREPEGRLRPAIEERLQHREEQNLVAEERIHVHEEDPPPVERKRGHRALRRIDHRAARLLDGVDEAHRRVE